MDEDYGEDAERALRKVNNTWSTFNKYIGETNSDLNLEEILKHKNLNKKPVISYGIIEFVLVEDMKGNRTACYHLFRRRNTVEYEILMRGFSQQSQMYHMLTLLSDDERSRILNNEWIDLWNDIWLDPYSPGVLSLKSKSQLRFPLVKELLIRMNKDMPNRIPQRPFIFPKGRAETGESGWDAAIREAREETGGRYLDGKVYFNSPLVSKYIGSDGNPYHDYYYVWQSTGLSSSPIVRLGDEKAPRIRNSTISSELESDLWLEIPVFHSNSQRLEWINSIDPYEEFGIFKRHFDAMMKIHSHFV
jgi:hypothetical protein